MLNYLKLQDVEDECKSVPECLTAPLFHDFPLSSLQFSNAIKIRDSEAYGKNSKSGVKSTGFISQ